MAEESSDPLRVEVLRRAEKLVGGRQNLCRYFNVPAALLAIWLGGIEPPPTKYFLKAVDLIDSEQLGNLTKHR
jgi:hypothetical protein